MKCPDCGTEMTILLMDFTPRGYHCPGCSKDLVECEVYSRTSGYLRPVSNWNTGKKQEFKDRKTYKVAGI